MWFLIIIFIDQIIKYMVVSSELSIRIYKEVFNFIYVQNTGGMYGSFENNNIYFIISSIVILSMLIVWLLTNKKKSKLQSFALQMIIAGGTSNLIDRIFRGAVVDFIQLKFFGVFNVSDVCIICGVIIICILELKEFFKSGNVKKSSN